MAELCILFRVMKLWTSPYHPQGDPVERFNRTLNSMSSHFINEEQDNWDQFIPLLSFAYNATNNSTTGFSPFYLMLGRPPMSLAETFALLPQSEGTTWGEEAKSAMKKALQTAYKDIIHRQNESAQALEKLNASVKFIPYKLDEEVLILDTTPPAGLRGKHRRRWIGPCKVTKVNGRPLSYVVLSRDRATHYNVHAELMKRVYKGPFEQHTWPRQAPRVMRVGRRKPHIVKNNLLKSSGPGVSSEGSSPVESKRSNLATRRVSLKKLFN
jgi:hypothetical protein